MQAKTNIEKQLIKLARNFDKLSDRGKSVMMQTALNMREMHDYYERRNAEKTKRS